MEGRGERFFLCTEVKEGKIRVLTFTKKRTQRKKKYGKED